MKIKIGKKYWVAIEDPSYAFNDERRYKAIKVPVLEQAGYELHMTGGETPKYVAGVYGLRTLWVKSSELHKSKKAAKQEVRNLKDWRIKNEIKGERSSIRIKKNYINKLKKMQEEK